MLKRAISAIAIAVVAAAELANFKNVPYQSGAVARAIYPFGAAFVDIEAGLVAPDGPPPELGCLDLGFEKADFQFVFTPAGAIKLNKHGK
jgi:hypothetical protein